MMTSLGSMAAISLAIVFAGTALTKLSNQTRTRTEFGRLGLPAPSVLAGLVPLAELIVAADLLISPRSGGLAAALLLCGFTTVLVSVLRSGRSVSCGCFGGLSQEPITYWTVARNGLLLMVAAIASSVEAVTAPDPAVVMVTGSVLLLATLAAQLLSLRHTVGPLWQISLAGEPNEGSAPSDDRAGGLVLDLQIDLDRQVERLVQNQTVTEPGSNPPTTGSSAPDTPSAGTPTGTQATRTEGLT